MRSVLDASRAALKQAGLLDADRYSLVAGLALAGVGRQGAVEALRAQPHPFAQMHVITDAQGALLGAHSGLDGAIVIAGTGSVGIGTVQNKALRVGGYGFPVSDEGSGAYLGLRAIQLSLRVHDGRLPASSLADSILAEFGHDPYQIVGWMDRAGATDYGRFAPRVIAHADAGDVMAMRVVTTAAGHVAAMLERLHALGATRLSLLGGLAEKLSPHLPPETRIRLKPADGDAVAGALIHARTSSAAA